MEQIEQLRERLNLLVVKGEDLYKGEILEVSQQLDELIYLQYKNANNSEFRNNANLIFNMQ